MVRIVSWCLTYCMYRICLVWFWYPIKQGEVVPKHGTNSTSYFETMKLCICSLIRFINKICKYNTFFCFQSFNLYYRLLSSEPDFNFNCTTAANGRWVTEPYMEKHGKMNYLKCSQTKQTSSILDNFFLMGFWNLKRPITGHFLLGYQKIKYKYKIHGHI